MEFHDRVNADKDWPIWQKRLLEAGMTEGNCEELYRQFTGSWDMNKRKPRLNDLWRFVRQETRATARERAERGPAVNRCAYCQDSGHLSILLPLKIGSMAYLLDAPGFRPPAIWALSPVYEADVPCICSQGQAYERHCAKREGKPMHEAWKRARELSLAAFGGNIVKMRKYQRACMDALKGQPPLQPEPAPEPYPLADRLNPALDVPEDEIPF